MLFGMKRLQFISTLPIPLALSKGRSIMIDDRMSNKVDREAAANHCQCSPEVANMSCRIPSLVKTRLTTGLSMGGVTLLSKYPDFHPCYSLPMRH